MLADLVPTSMLAARSSIQQGVGTSLYYSSLYTLMTQGSIPSGQQLVGDLNGTLSYDIDQANHRAACHQGSVYGCGSPPIRVPPIRVPPIVNLLQIRSAI